MSIEGFRVHNGALGQTLGQLKSGVSTTQTPIVLVGNNGPFNAHGRSTCNVVRSRSCREGYWSGAGICCASFYCNDLKRSVKLEREHYHVKWELPTTGRGFLCMSLMRARLGGEHRCR